MVPDEAMEKRIDELMEEMTLEEKVGQLMQADIKLIPCKIRNYGKDHIFDRV